MARYSDAEVEEILRRAIERQQKDVTGVSHDDLVAAAGEIGIAAADVEAAVAEVRAGKTGEAPARADVAESPAVVDDDAALDAQDRKSRRARFTRHLATYVVVNAFLAGMNVLTGGQWWVLWVILGWGIGVALQGLGLLLPEDPRRRERRLRRLQARRDKEARRFRERDMQLQKKQTRRAREKDFERAVQEGVGLLMTAAARKIGEAVEKARQAEARRDGVRVDVGDDRVRVEVPDEEQDEQKQQKDAGGARGAGARKPG